MENENIVSVESVKRLLRVFKRNIWFIIATIIAVTAIGAVYSYRRPYVYSACEMAVFKGKYSDSVVLNDYTITNYYIDTFIDFCDEQCVVDRANYYYAEYLKSGSGDVSEYVKRGSALDKEALRRSTSVYFPDRVIPMLPKELSNGICSLNPDENRLTLSAIINLDKSGDIVSYRFCKSVIRSRVKGIYSEINRILDGTADEYIKEKYRDLNDEIFLMNLFWLVSQVSPLCFVGVW